MLKRQLNRFLVVGFTTVFIDFLIYSILVFLNINISFSKAIGFSAGSIFAYFANKSYTFSGAEGGVLKFLIFISIYLSTLFVNVISNKAILDFVSQERMGYLFAFIIATGLSASLNFIGMKLFVFNKMSEQTNV